MWENGEEEEKGEEEEVEEAMDPIILGKGTRPPEEEVENHNCAGHIPFRSWCAHCRKMRAIERRERAREQPTVSVDWMWMTKKEEGEVGMPTMVHKDHRGGWVSADVVPAKG